MFRFSHVVASLTACASLSTLALAAPSLIYANSTDVGAIKIYDPATGNTNTAYLGSSLTVGGLAADDVNKRIYVSAGSGGTISSPTDNLFVFDYDGNLVSQTRINFVLGSFSSFAPTGLTVANGTLYAVKAHSTSGRAGIYAINPTTGATTLAGALSNVDPPGSPTINANPLDIAFDAVNNRFVTTNGIVTSPSSARGIYAFTLPATAGDLVTTTFLSAPPTSPTLPTGVNQPDGIAVDGNIAYLTYNRSNQISRFDLTTNTYLSNVTGATQTDGSSGDAAFATNFVGQVPEPALLALVPAVALGLARRRRA